LEKPKVNARFRFEQSDERKDFFFHLYSFFAAKQPQSSSSNEDEDAGLIFVTVLLS